MKTPGNSFYERVEKALADDQLRRALATGTYNLVSKRAAAMHELPHAEQIRDRARQVRAHTLGQLDTYLARFADRVEAAGGRVFWAGTAAEANEYVLGLARSGGARLVVKSKSRVTEEIGLGLALQQENIEVVESDLGEFIIQLAQEGPSHIVVPAMHKSRQEVGRLFQQHLAVPYTDDPAALNQVARSHLRRIFLAADMGISGVNFGVAESGSICLVTNEGNGRLTTTAPRVHVAVMGMERLVPTLADLGLMLQLLGRSATGQKLTVYSSILTGPRQPGEEDGPEEFHLVILDNGRSRVLASDLAEILYCIRCGACLNSCPVYQQIGGHAYGSVYPGPIGSVLTPALEGVETWGELAHASSLCGACQEVCPVRIDIPRLLLKLRDRGQKPAWLKLGLQGYRTVAQQPPLFRVGLSAAGMASRLLARQGWFERLPGPLQGWTRYRAFPAVARKSFAQLWTEREANQKDGP